jgi:hypothetical protein
MEVWHMTYSNLMWFTRFVGFWYTHWTFPSRSQSLHEGRSRPQRILRSRQRVQAKSGIVYSERFYTAVNPAIMPQITGTYLLVFGCHFDLK